VGSDIATVIQPEANTDSGYESALGFKTNPAAAKSP